MNDRDPAAMLRFTHALIDETDRILRSYFAGEFEVSLKADETYVTVADRQVESVLRSRLAEAFPGHGFVGEEYGEEQGRGEARWIIDPIDATANFVRGIPVFGTLLALERDGALVVGVASAPALQQRWWASAGAGAFTRAAGRERQIRVSDVAHLEDAQLVFGTLRTIDANGRLPAWMAAVRRSRRDRGFGDFWGHMFVAQGSAEAMLEETGVSIWDLAAPHIIVAEAGGRMTDLAGRASWSGPDALTSNGLLHDEVLAMLSAGSVVSGSGLPRGEHFGA
ncbi:MAG TPA: inositol monophosphatase family protein [Candidatus Limnocylindria bacterium]|nr:inositol monophosphatase family protein [Candidatus Limnocylindria bacterium]